MKIIKLSGDTMVWLVVRTYLPPQLWCGVFVAIWAQVSLFTFTQPQTVRMSNSTHGCARSSSCRRCSCSPVSSREPRWWSPFPPSSTQARSPEKSSCATSVHPARTWPRTAPPPRQPSARRAKASTTPSCGTTCPGACTAAPSAARTRRWTPSVRRSTTECVGANGAFTPTGTSASDTPSARRDAGFRRRVQDCRLSNGPV